MQTWLKFDAPDDEEASHAALIFTEDGETRIEWWNEDVGIVRTVHATSVQNAERWLTDRGYTDYTA